jgi:bifunctional non-homologous end joining protein LigD
VPDPVILDGEIVALGHGRPDFELLQSRMHVRHPPGRLVRAVPVQLYLFDLLHHGEQSLLQAPYAQRRDRLEDLGLDQDPVRTPPWYHGGARDIQAVSLAHGLEGIVGKPTASAYYPGQRRDWIKVKNLRHQEVIICGWTSGRAAGKTSSARCCSASTTAGTCGTSATSAPGSPRPCSRT